MSSPPSSSSAVVRRRFLLRGAVQGVGFRPFVFRLAAGLGLAGWVSNSNEGVQIEVEGVACRVELFQVRLLAERPKLAWIQACETTTIPVADDSGFEIRESDREGVPSAIVLPDVATCADCLSDIFDRSNRRHRYPFTNCTHCGPRFSLIGSLPYDRPNTSMRDFALCDRCRAEYEDPADRRFHAQPNACPDCGPRLAWLDRDGRQLAVGEPALDAAVGALHSGQIVAVKGLGGFHLMVAAHREDSIERLRASKQREEKPFALMVPSMSHARGICDVSNLDEALLTSPQAPIVLLRRTTMPAPTAAIPAQPVAHAVAPGNPWLGVMLPYTPLHHLLLRDLDMPVVATSGNRRNEPICIDEEEAVERLQGIADSFLVHNRPILRHVDDSIVRVVAGRELVIRRARGYAPLPVQLKQSVGPLLAVGGFLKNTLAVARGTQVFLSQHIGDLETPQAIAAFRSVAADLQSFYAVTPDRVACDRHPDYPSTRLAAGFGRPLIQVQHHHAHVLACVAEHGIEEDVLGVAWDGTGLGDDGTIWGGEFLLVSGRTYRRFGHLRTFRLPGGDNAATEPRRSAFSILFELLGDDVIERHDLPPVAAFDLSQRHTLRRMLHRGVNSPWTSSMGRLFDAVASLLGLRQTCSFEGQAAMEIEFLADGAEAGEAYPFGLRDGPALVMDWEPTLRAVLADLASGAPRGRIAARFHETLVEAIVGVAARAGRERIVLSGGCFQNARLLGRSVERLRGAGYDPIWPRYVPPNDGGIALGQVIAAAW